MDTAEKTNHGRSGMARQLFNRTFTQGARVMTLGSFGEGKTLMADVVIRYATARGLDIGVRDFSDDPQDIQKRASTGQRINELRRTLECNLHLKLSIPQLAALLEVNPILQDDLMKWGGSDTQIAGTAASLISRSLIGEDWPLNMDMDDTEFEAFERRFYRAARNAGYTLTLENS